MTVVRQTYFQKAEKYFNYILYKSPAIIPVASALPPPNSTCSRWEWKKSLPCVWNHCEHLPLSFLSNLCNHNHLLLPWTWKKCNCSSLFFPRNSRHPHLKGVPITSLTTTKPCSPQFRHWWRVTTIATVSHKQTFWAMQLRSRMMHSREGASVEQIQPWNELF